MYFYNSIIEEKLTMLSKVWAAERGAHRVKSYVDIPEVADQYMKWRCGDVFSHVTVVWAHV
jgi:hypothetical protein